MIELSQAFSMIGKDERCQDVASSLALQGTDIGVSIPIYEIFYLKILGGPKSSNLASTIQEYNAIRRMAETCGAVAVTINVMDIDLLTLIGAVLIFTPRTGMNMFMRLGDILSNPELPEEVLKIVLDALGIPMSDFLASTVSKPAERDLKVINIVFEKLMESLQKDLHSKGIRVRDWDELPSYYEDIYRSGEMHRMAQFRSMVQAPTL